MRRPAVLALAVITLVAAGLAVGAFCSGAESPVARAAEADFGAASVQARISGNVAEVLLSPGSLEQLSAADARLAAMPGVAAVQSPASYLAGTVTATQALLAATVGRVPWARAQRAAHAEAGRLAAAGVAPATAAAGAEEERVRTLGPRLGATYTSTLIRLGLDTYPTLADQDFLQDTIFGTGTTPKPSVRWLVPSGSSALVMVAVRAGATPAQLHRISAALLRALAPLRASTGDGIALVGASGTAAHAGASAAADAGASPAADSGGTTVSFAVGGTDLLSAPDLRWLTAADARIAASLPGAALAPDLGSLLGSAPAGAAATRRLWAQLPSGLTGTALSADHRVGEVRVTLAAGMSASAGAARVRSALEGAPAGVTVAPVGALTLAASHDAWPPLRILLIVVAALGLIGLARVLGRRDHTSSAASAPARQPAAGWRRFTNLTAMSPVAPGSPRRSLLTRLEARR